jgi:hypothetical protein
MFTESERRVLQEHAAIIDRFEAGQRAEWIRLQEPHKALIREARWQILPDHYPPDPTFQLTRSPAETEREFRDLHDRLMLELDRWSGTHQPTVEPWNTPAKLAAWINKELELMRLGAVRFYKGGEARREGAPPEYDETEARNVYIGARERAILFETVVPQIRTRLPIRDDYVLGLMEIRDWFAVAATDYAEQPSTVLPLAAKSIAQSSGNESSYRYRTPEGNQGSEPVAKLVHLLRKHRPRAGTQIALVEFMQERESAPFEEIAHHVHGNDETSGAAIRRNVSRTNETLAELKQSINFRTSGSHVIKRIDPL